MKRFVPEHYGITSLAEAERLAELTNRIIASLKVIEESNVNLNEMAAQTSAIVTNLRVIGEDA